MPIFTALGAECTVLDYSPLQLDSERVVALREGYEIEIIRGDMTKTLPFDEGQFDIIFHPVSNCYVEDVRHVWRECFRVLRPGGFSVMYDVHPFNRPFTGEPWKEPRIVKAYSDTLPSCHWRVQDLVNANLSAGLSLKEMAELAAVSASFWYSYDELVRQDGEKLKNINDWQSNPMAALPEQFHAPLFSRQPRDGPCLDG